MRKKPNRKYMTTRVQYKAAKSYDHAQFDAFCTNIYAEGFRDGEKSVKGADITDVMKRIKAVKGIGEKRLAQIEQAISELMDNNESEGKQNENNA
nr:MAG TPA: hypothetical protein [Caudoviricetes sp.]